MSEQPEKPKEPEGNGNILKAFWDFLHVVGELKSLRAELEKHRRIMEQHQITKEELEMLKKLRQEIFENAEERKQIIEQKHQTMLEAVESKKEDLKKEGTDKAYTLLANVLDWVRVDLVEKQLLPLQKKCSDQETEIELLKSKQKSNWSELFGKFSINYSEFMDSDFKLYSSDWDKFQSNYIEKGYIDKGDLNIIDDIESPKDDEDEDLENDDEQK